MKKTLFKALKRIENLYQNIKICTTLPFLKNWKKKIKKIKTWQIENSETLEISEISDILFRVFLFPSLPFCPIAKIENSEKNAEVSKFSTWPQNNVLRRKKNYQRHFFINLLRFTPQ